MFIWNFKKNIRVVGFLGKPDFLEKGLFSLCNIVCDLFWNIPRRFYCPQGDIHQKIGLNKFQDIFFSCEIFS